MLTTCGSRFRRARTSWRAISKSIADRGRLPWLAITRDQVQCARRSPIMEPAGTHICQLRRSGISRLFWGMEGRREDGEALYGVADCGPVPVRNVRLVHLPEWRCPA